MARFAVVRLRLAWQRHRILTFHEVDVTLALLRVHGSLSRRYCFRRPRRRRKGRPAAADCGPQCWMAERNEKFKQPLLSISTIHFKPPKRTITNLHPFTSCCSKPSLSQLTQRHFTVMHRIGMVA